MSKKYFEIKAACQFMTREQSANPTTETYLVVGKDCRDAQANFYREFAAMCWTDPVVNSVSRSAITSIIGDESASGIFKARSIAESIDARSGNEKQHVKYTLVNANSLETAIEILHFHYLQDDIMAWHHEAIQRVNYTDIYDNED